jgi:hypothetical protein
MKKKIKKWVTFWPESVLIVEQLYKTKTNNHENQTHYF